MRNSVLWQVPERAADDESAPAALPGGGRDDAELPVGREEAGGAARPGARAAHGVGLLVRGPGHRARRGALPALRARRRRARRGRRGRAARTLRALPHAPQERLLPRKLCRRVPRERAPPPFRDLLPHTPLHFHRVLPVILFPLCQLL